MPVSLYQQETVSFVAKLVRAEAKVVKRLLGMGVQGAHFEVMLAVVVRELQPPWCARRNRAVVKLVWSWISIQVSY